MKVLAKRLREGDRILFGSSICKVVSKSIYRKKVSVMLQKGNKEKTRFTWVTHLNNEVKLVN